MSKSGGKARPNATVGSSTKLKLDYMLTGPGGYRTTGTVEVKAVKDNPLGLAAGAFLISPLIAGALAGRTSLGWGIGLAAATVLLVAGLALRLPPPTSHTDTVRGSV